jgi:hypothetical protein
MKRLMGLAFAILISATSLAAAAADVSGKWSGSFADDRASAPLFLILTQDGPKLTGTGGPTEAKQAPVENGTIQEDVMTFVIHAGPSTLVFDLRIKGEEITGTVEVKRDGEATRTGQVSLKRIASH